MMALSLVETGTSRIGLLFRLTTACAVCLLMIVEGCIGGGAVALARSLPDTRGPVADGIGVAVRAPEDNDLAAIKAMGFSMVRTTLSWDATEKIRGRYDFRYYLRGAARMKAHGLRPVYVLAYGNALYSPLIATRRYAVSKQRPAAPATPAAVTAYVRWAAEAARHFAPYDPIFEIWNEPDVNHWWPPESNPDAYAALLEASCAGVRAARTGIPLIGPGIAKLPGVEGQDAGFIMTLMAQGRLRCLDAVSIHSYPDKEGALREGAVLKDVVAQAHDMPGGARPVIVSEWGWDTRIPADEEAQAAFIIRSLVSHIAQGIAINIWYEWKDQITEYGDDQGHFGLLRSDGTRKPAAIALKTFLSHVGALRFECQHMDQDGISYAIFRQQSGGRAVAIASNSGGPGLLPKWDIQGVWLMDGRRKEYAGGGSRLSVPADGSLFYVHFQPGQMDSCGH